MSDIKSATTEDLRLRNYLAQQRQRGDIEIHDLESKHSDEIQRLTESQTLQVDQMRRDYDVRISEEAGSLDERLTHLREENQERLGNEQRAGDVEYTRVHNAYQQKIDEYKKNAESQLDSLRKQYQASTEALHERARKNVKREKEISGA